MCITFSLVVIQQTLNLYANISVQFIWGVVKPEEAIVSLLCPSPPPLVPPPSCCAPVPSLTATFAIGGPFIESIELRNCRKAWIWGEGTSFVFWGFSKLRQLNKTSEKQQRWDEGCEGSVWPRRRWQRWSSPVDEQEQRGAGVAQLVCWSMPIVLVLCDALPL